MKVFQVINLHRYGGGADAMAEGTARLLSRKGHESILLTRDSRELGRGGLGKARAFVCGFYSRSGRRIMTAALEEHAPDLVHVHGVYPFFSPWILQDCRRARVPVVLACHDYRLTCPTAVHLCHDAICESCLGGREYWCFLKNCRNNRLESLGYALRSMVARKWRLFLDNVTIYTTPSEFVKRRLTDAGLPHQRIIALPNMVPVPDAAVDPSANNYIVYVGRFSPEKGIDTLLASAGTTGLRVRLAGDHSPMNDAVATAPSNVEFMGRMKPNEVGALYQHARFAVLPSLWFETFGLVAAEAMSYGLPVIASNIGGLTEVVDHGVTGFLTEPGDAGDLARKMKLLWDRPELCRKMGQAAREKVIREYSEDVYYKRLMAVYEQAVGSANVAPST